jgi:hypothetical protein
MEFETSFEHQSLRELVRDFGARELQPTIHEYEEQERFPRHLPKRLGELDLLDLGTPEQEYRALAEQCIVLEELARVSAGLASAISVTGYLVPNIVRALGTPEQIERYAAPLISGDQVAGFALTEPDAGSDVRSIRTKAVRTDGGYRINGSKMFTSNAPVADFLLVVAYTDSSKGIDGMSIFVVDIDTPGCTVMQKLKKESIRTCETSAVSFDDCEIPAGNLLGAEGEGFRRVMKGLNADRMYNVARSLGIAQASFEAAKGYAQERRQFGKPIGSHQAIAFKLADMVVKLDAARLLAQRAAWLYDTDRPFVQQVSVAKLYVSEVCVEIAREAVQIHGGYGVIREMNVARYLRDSLLGPIGAGTSEIQRRIIARQLGLEVY